MGGQVVMVANKTSVALLGPVWHNAFMQPNKAPTKRKSGRPVKYPWQKWLSGCRYTLVKGEHFDCEAYALVIQLRRKASTMNKRVVANIYGDKIVFKARSKHAASKS
jgi:hypothetical protein